MPDLPSPLVSALRHRYEAQVVALARRTRAKRILVTHCGDGAVLDLLARAGLRAEIHGCDPSSLAVTRARERLGDLATIRLADAEELEPRDDEDGPNFDLVVMLSAFERAQTPEKLLALAGRLSRRYVLLGAADAPAMRGANLLRARHLRGLGVDPESHRRWPRRRFIDWVGTRFRVLAAPRVPPWTLVLAERIY